MIPLLLGALAYINTLRNGFVHDDHHFIETNRALDHFSSALPWRSIQTTGGTFFRPLGVLFMACTEALFGRNPTGFHIAAMALHLVVVAMTLRFASALLSWPAAVAAAAVFAVHPVHVEAVTALSNNSEVLTTVFALALLSSHIARGPIGARRSLTENALMLCALLSKESAVTLPLLVVASEWLLRREESPLRSGLRLVPAVAVYLLLRRVAMPWMTYPGAFGYFFGVSLSTRVLTVASILPEYARLLVFPRTLSAVYGRHAFNDMHGLSPSVALGIALALAVPAAVVALRKRAPALAFSLAAVVIPLTLYLHVTPLGTLMAERFLYLSSLGVALAAGFGYEAVSTRTRSSLAASLAAVVLLAGVARTADRNLDWRSDRALSTADIQTYPLSDEARANFGGALCAGGRRDESLVGMRLLEVAVVQLPRNGFHLHNLAVCHMNLKNYPRVLELNLQGQRLFPMMASFRFGAALALNASGRFDEAATQSLGAVRMDPDNPEFAGILRDSILRSPDPGATVARLQAVVRTWPARPQRAALGVLGAISRSRVL